MVGNQKGLTVRINSWAIESIIIYDPDKSKRLPIATTAQTATMADIEVIEELLKLCKGKLDILLVDRAIYDFEQINKWYLLYDILVIV